jgi:hypothetical protein
MLAKPHTFAYAHKYGHGLLLRWTPIMVVKPHTFAYAPMLTNTDVDS